MDDSVIEARRQNDLRSRLDPRAPLREDAMNALSPNPPQPGAALAPGLAESPGPLSDALDHFRSVATMLELIDRLPDLAEDIRNWRPRDVGQSSPDETGPLDMVSRHALDAVMTGLAMLGVAAATLCGNSQGRLEPDEIVTCQEIGAAMTSLLERAKALLEIEDVAHPTAERAELFRSFLR